ncbi:MAG: alpha/beta hydrolase [Acidobacteria bacterium]|nr:alpha/beta hydrolase [Acidobacteriota bacterium]
MGERTGSFAVAMAAIAFAALAFAGGSAGPLGAETAAKSRPVAPESSTAGEILPAPPEHPDPTKRYLFYLHGRIVEDAGPRPSNELFGTYEYPEILDRMAAAGFVVISEQRAPATDPATYSERVAEQVKTLLAAGVPAERITVSGFSKGGGIAVLTSARLAEPRVNFVFMGACAGGPPDPKIHVSGYVLTIHEDSDRIASPCGPLLEQAGEVPAKRAITIHTGRGHGAFWQPRDEWLGPLLEWARTAGGRDPE